jgi:hypothetical protein
VLIAGAASVSLAVAAAGQRAARGTYLRSAWLRGLRKWNRTGYTPCTAGPGEVCGGRWTGSFPAPVTIAPAPGAALHSSPVAAIRTPVTRSAWRLTADLVMVPHRLPARPGRS